MKPVVPVVLTGTYVRLEPLVAGHLSDLERVAEPGFWTHMGEGPFGPTGFSGYLAEADADRDAGSRVAFAVIDQKTGKAIGSTSIGDIATEHARAEIGWTWYARSYWGGVTNPESKLLLMAHLFEDLGAVRVALKTGHRNTRSLGAIARLGATREGTLRQHMILPNGSVRDTVYFSVIAEDWPSVKLSLVARLDR